MRIIAIGILLCVWTAAAASDSLDVGGLRIDLVAIAPGQVGGATVTRPFLIGRTPVTRGQFARYVAATNYRTEAEAGTSGGFGLVDGALVQRPGFSWRNPGYMQDDDHPVVLVTWQDATAFCAWAASASGRIVDLPSEAEWSLAAAQAADEPPASGGTRSVGAGPGLTGMRGLVHHWCRDWFQEAPAAGIDPVVVTAPAGTARRVLRGGSFLKRDERWRNTPGSRNADNGFRIVVRERSPAALPAIEAPANPSVTAFPSSPPPMSPMPPVGAPGPGAHAHASSGCGIGALILLAIGGVVAVIMVIASIFRTSSAARPTRLTRGTGPRVAEILDDGFRIDPTSCPSGQQVAWQAMVRGQTQSGTCMTTTAGTLVYTGRRPSQIVLTLGAVSGMGALDDASIDSDPIARDPTTTAAAWTRPSAY